MQNTPNYNYNLPEYSDSADIAVLNANFSSIDANEHRIEGEVDNHDTRISALEEGVDLEKSATNSFDDGIDSYFKKVVSSIVPIQAGSGTPSPTNVRAISGFTECTVTDADDETSPTQTNTATIQFGSAGTVYGGYVDLISGKLVVDKKMFTDNGSMNWSSTSTGFVLSVADSGINDCKNASTTNTPIVCNISERATSVWQDGKIGIDFKTIWVGDTDKSIYTDVAGLKAFLSTNPIQILYPLATPQEYQLTPAQLRSLVGANRLTSSTGEVTEVEYIKNKTIAWLLDLIRT